MPTRLLLLARHGEQEQDGAGLSERGRRQAVLLGERLSRVPLAAVHHGPLPRAAETAALVARSLPGVPVHATDLAGDHLPHRTDPAGLPSAYARFLDGLTEAERVDGPRVTAAAARHFGRPPDAGDVTELVVTHAFLVGWLVRDALDAPEPRWLGLNPLNCGLTVIRYTDGLPPRLVAFNDAAHLPAELRGTGLPPEYQV
ncbi:histidine phosphatase family protein [Micromonospora endolithica]|uniref:Histidine phosphatase family protein n=1 Tax=Micromonospora endolithica TaxID=230091 RepID=A0A3A9YS57_9ACTN|nr:histidine phosphatase family protein [Micromonospora endolithica]RKN38888.1 histidine phosphatase family protein [Micromonospora endolithica]TWJ25514.1 putative phosphoglycerate mutase [Micromonospora endolithica]